MSETFRGVMKDHNLVVLEHPLPLPDGTPVEVTPLPRAPGTPEAVRAAMSSAPKLTAEDVAELDRVIAEGKRPPANIDPFE